MPSSKPFRQMLPSLHPGTCSLKQTANRGKVIRSGNGAINTKATLAGDHLRPI